VRTSEGIDVAVRKVTFRLPVPGLPRATFVTDYGLRGGRLIVDGFVVLDAPSRDALQRGASAVLAGTALRLAVQAVDDEIVLFMDGAEVAPEERLQAPSSRSAWMHGFIALAGSAFGFIAGYLYVLRADELGDPWSMRMAWHMAAWHLLLTLTLFPTSVWGQRAGIRAVQVTSFLFFAIHAGIALSNLGEEELAQGGWIALLNAASGLAFLAAVFYGQRAYAHMNPLGAVDFPRASTLTSGSAPG
jgi:hypothetical protein